MPASPSYFFSPLAETLESKWETGFGGAARLNFFKLFAVGFYELLGFNISEASPEEITIGFFSSSFSPTNWRTSWEIWEAERAGKHAVLTVADWALTSSKFVFLRY